MITEFIGREQESGFLEGKYKDKGFDFIPIYGRRRIGKTELILHFIKNKDSVYFLATSGTKKDNIEGFKTAAKPVIDLSYVKNDWEAIFEYMKSSIKKRTVIVIDEFPYLIGTEKGLSSIFQRIVDLHLMDSNIFLILAGSSLSMMYKEVLAYKAPLYGRRTGQIELKELRFREVKKFFDKPIDEIIRIYAVCGGVPSYLNEFREKKPFYGLVEEKILRRDSILRDDVAFLLRQEFREPKTYMSILSAISLGNTRLGKIINYCGFKDKTGIMPYLHGLEYLGYVERHIPVTERRSRKSLYSIKNNFFNFWFRFVRNNLSLIDENIDLGISRIEKDFNPYLGFVFERIAKEFLWETMPVPFTRLGRWWHREQEIDLVALGDKEIGFFEVKWSDLGLKEARRVLDKLEEKAEYIDYERKKEHFGIIAKNIKDKERLREEGFICYDFRDLNKIRG